MGKEIPEFFKTRLIWKLLYLHPILNTNDMICHTGRINYFKSTTHVDSFWISRAHPSLGLQFNFFPSTLFAISRLIKDPRLLYNLLIAGGRMIGFIHLPRVFVLGKTNSLNLDLNSNSWTYSLPQKKKKKKKKKSFSN